jgi:hypothetical protein
MEMGGVCNSVLTYCRQLFAKQSGTPLKAVNAMGQPLGLRFETRSNLNHLVLSEVRVAPLQFCAPRVLAMLTQAALEAQWVTGMALEAGTQLLAAAIERETQGESAEETFAELFAEDEDGRILPRPAGHTGGWRRAVEILTECYEGEGFVVSRVCFDLECVKRTPRGDVSISASKPIFDQLRQESDKENHKARVSFFWCCSTTSRGLTLYGFPCC